MNAADVIEAYVTDVARRLPRQQRNDVAFELRALLQEELHAQAQDAGRAPDATMALALVQGYGPPAEMAARYRPQLTVIDPADGPTFLRVAVIGLAVIWAAGLLESFPGPQGELLSALGHWWTTSVIPSLWWPGVLVVWFGIAAWVRRRWPRTSTSVWTPPHATVLRAVSRAWLVVGLIGIVCGVLVLLNPSALLDVLFGGRAAPAAYQALTYTEVFLQRQAPLLLALIVTNIPLLIAVLVRGRWTTLLRRIETGLSLVICLVMMWTVLDGPVVLAPVSDQTLKFALVAITALTLLDLGLKAFRNVRPAPNR